MSDEATTTATSEADQNSGEPENTGAADSGSGGGTDSGADQFAQERERFEEQRRTWQAERDRERAAREKAEKELADLKGAGSQEEPLTPTKLADFLDQRDRQRSLAETANSLKSDEAFKHADPAIFERYADFDSPEALRVAAEQSHNRVAEVAKSTSEAAVQAVLKDVSEKYGLDLAPAPSTKDAQAPAGDPTIEQLEAMPFDEFEAVPEEVRERVLRSANL